jgi:hypothetical protein
MCIVKLWLRLMWRPRPRLRATTADTAAPDDDGEGDDDDRRVRGPTRPTTLGRNDNTLSRSNACTSNAATNVFIGTVDGRNGNK